MAVVGVGVDLVDVARLTEVLARTPGVLNRLFTAGEQAALGDRATPERWAARVAAKEAAHKALHVGTTPRWHEVEVQGGDGRPPKLVVSGSVAVRAADLGINHWWLSISHDGGYAVALVIAES